MGRNDDKLIIYWIIITRPLSTTNSWASCQPTVHVLCQGDTGGDHNEKARQIEQSGREKGQAFPTSSRHHGEHMVIC